MKYLLDTCVISEAIKTKPDHQVIAWLAAQQQDNLYLSVLTFGEIEKGIEKLAQGKRKNKLRLWIKEDLKQQFAHRILPIDTEAAIVWGRIQGQSEKHGRPLPAIDSLIAATALAHHYVLVTRNITDVASAVETFNPWESR